MNNKDTPETDVKKIALRMIPYGLYVLTARASEEVTAATITWVTQTAFKPTLVVAGIRADSRSHALIKQSGVFNLNVLGKGQQAIAFSFFKPSVLEDGRLSGHKFRPAANGCPILEDAPAWLECKLVNAIEGADHSVFVGEVTGAGLNASISGRPDELTLHLRDLGEKIHYGG
ncbi:MAG: flavin reductase [Gammaproteobacteria bacterium]|jgi:flavin reductase (DIM6/NTAB) family NADH-FMN oxidoreductase RutF|nr:MAG: flavin reductase [Gammaproteobacteria bacterium]